MPTINEVIKKSLNPFDNSAARNFWEEQELSPTVESIHQKQLTQIKSVLREVIQDHKTRTLILYGDAGSGKTHFLGQLKQNLNDQAFFVYIEPFSQSDHIWRHILRNAVDSLVNAPAGQTDSQLILWLKSCLSTIRKGLKSDQQRLVDTIKSFFGKTDAVRDRQLFIDILKKTIGTTGIYNANEFFGVLYDLTNPDLYSLACEWLKGDDLDEESLKKLKVKQSIDDEDKARGILGNFSKISDKTQPIVLCFDNLDSIARLPDGSTDIQALFNVTSTIYNGNWKGFLIIISIRLSTWNDNYKRVRPSDLDRASIRIPLKRITLEEAEALLATRLYPLHNQAQPQPVSPIYPLTQQMLEKEFPSRKASPRKALELGKVIFQDYKKSLLSDDVRTTQSEQSNDEEEQLETEYPEEKIFQAEFQLLWQQEYKTSQEKITKISLLAAIDLMRMLEQALTALQVQGIKPKLLSGRYAGYSLSYLHPGKQERVGIVWTEDPSMTSFFNVMNACQKVIQQNICQTLYLIRDGGVGKANLAGNQIYKQIFTETNHIHIKPTLSSIHYLATYHSLVKAAEANELEFTGKIINLKKLETFICDSQILHQCTLLQNLGIVANSPKNIKNGEDKNDLQPVKEFLFNLVVTQGYMGVPTLIQRTEKQFSSVKTLDIQQLVQQLCQEQKTQIIDPKAKLQDQLICLVTKN
ncbi:MAG: ATP-binding protein [Rhizonema sp. PD37]|nr:ATP-binding protein [Rhizonema sp. PD37]